MKRIPALLRTEPMLCFLQFATLLDISKKTARITVAQLVKANVLEEKFAERHREDGRGGMRRYYGLRDTSGEPQQEYSAKPAPVPERNGTNPFEWRTFDARVWAQPEKWGSVIRKQSED